MSLRLLPIVASCPFLLSQLISALSWTDCPHTTSAWSHCAKINITHWSFEVPSRINLGSWCQNVAHSYCTLALINSAAEYCAPVWGRSAHIRLMDKPINNVLRLVTGCLRPTPTYNLFVLSGISPTELC